MTRITRLRQRIVETIRTNPASRPETVVMPTLDAAYIRGVIDLAMRVAESLTAVGASANDVLLSTTRVAAAYGLSPVHVDITYNAIGVSYLNDQSEQPTTIIRVVRASVPDHSKLQALQALVAEIEAGDLDLPSAHRKFHAIRRQPFRYRPALIVLMQALLAVGVGLLYKASWPILGVIFIAACCAALVQRLLTRWHLPFFFAQAAGAFVIVGCAALANWLSSIGTPFLEHVPTTVIVASGIVLMLAGMSVVAAAQDAIDGFALTAGGLILDLAMLTLGVVIGIVGGVRLADAFGIGIPLSNTPPERGFFALQLVATMMIAAAVAVWNGARLGTVVISGALGLIAWSGYSLVGLTGMSDPVSCGVGALLSSFIGTLIAHRFHVPSIAVTTAAIVPMVPGSAVFRGILAISQAQQNSASILSGLSELIGAVAIGVALAAGASLGFYLGAPLRDTLQSTMRRQRRIR